MGSVKTGVILKDVSLEVHGGEVLAVLGSKGATNDFSYSLASVITATAANIIKFFFLNAFNPTGIF
jgi:ABC-type lipopolysaccharide export system ATPase subunit